MSFKKASNTTAMQVNALDFVLFPLYFLCILVPVGIVNSTPMGFDLGATLISLGSGHGFSIANIAAIATIGYVAYTNDWRMRKGNQAYILMQAWVAAATVVFLIAPPFFPIVADTMAQPLGAIAAVVFQTGGYAAFSYLG